MKKVTVLVIIVFFAFSLFAIEDVFKEADQLYKERANVENLKKAISIVEEYFKKNPKSYDAAWRLSMFYFSLGDKVSKGQKVKIYDKAVKYGKEAVKLNDKGVEGHFWLGASYGKYGESRGVMKSLFLVKPIKKEMKRVLELDETYECAGVYRVLGRLYFKVPGLFGGSKSKSLKYLLKEKEMCPSNPLGRYYLADTLRKKGKKKEAIKELEWILNLKEVDPRWAPEFENVLKDAKKLYNKLTK